MRVYIAGPYSANDPQDVELNVQVALTAAHLLADAGAAPYCPHLTHYWDKLYPRFYEEWLRIDNAWVAVSELVVRLAGESDGADAEVVLAKSLNIPVMNLEDALAYVTMQAATPTVPPE